MKRAPMTAWFDPFALLRHAPDVLAASVFGQRADTRVIEALAAPQAAPIDCSREENGAPIGEFWMDFVADSGDGFNPTYAIAWRHAALAGREDSSGTDTRQTRPDPRLRRRSGLPHALPGALQGQAGRAVEDCPPVHRSAASEGLRDPGQPRLVRQPRRLLPAFLFARLVRGLEDSPDAKLFRAEAPAPLVGDRDGRAAGLGRRRAAGRIFRARGPRDGAGGPDHPLHRGAALDLLPHLPEVRHDRVHGEQPPIPRRESVRDALSAGGARGRFPVGRPAPLPALRRRRPPEDRLAAVGSLHRRTDRTSRRWTEGTGSQSVFPSRGHRRRSAGETSSSSRSTRPSVS